MLGLNVNEFLRNSLLNTLSAPAPAAAFRRYLSTETKSLSSRSRLTEVQPPASVSSSPKADGVQIRQSGAILLSEYVLNMWKNVEAKPWLVVIPAPWEAEAGGL